MSKGNRSRNQKAGQANSSDSPLLKIAIAVIGALALIIVALINRSTATLPAEFTQTAEARHTAVALTTFASVLQPTNTFVPSFTIPSTSAPISMVTETAAAASPIPSITAVGASASSPEAMSANGLPLIRTIPGTTLVMNSAISFDGSMLALAASDGTIRVVSTREDRLIGSLKAGTGILSLVFSPDGQMVAAGLASTTVKVWRLNDGVELPTLEGLPGGVFNVAFSPDGRMVAASAEP